jgi:phosphoribosylamine--glycine ligase
LRKNFKNKHNSATNIKWRFGMKIMVIGQGAREHALAWMFSKSRRIGGLYIAPGNAGTRQLGTNVECDPLDFEGIARFCHDKSVEYVFVGPEGPLAAGIVDVLNKEGIHVIGPHQKAARLESSKTFSKEFMFRYGIPTARSKTFDSKDDDFEEYIRSLKGRWVIKKSGLAEGKGVLESDNHDELIRFGKQILENDSLLVEEFLDGYEVSIFVLSDGIHFITLPPCSDFKKAYDGDKGPNTGGMGSICPVPWVDTALKERIKLEIIEPTFRGLEHERLNYKGVLYFGLMITKDGPKLLEYNVRFGDPETQVLLPGLKTDFGDFTESIAKGTLDSLPIHESGLASVGVVVAADGYPGTYRKGIPIASIPKISEKDALVFHSSTIIDDSKATVTGGGRCFTVVGFGKDTIEAASRAYNAVKYVHFDGAWYRTDIGKKFFIDEG